MNGYVTFRPYQVALNLRSVGVQRKNVCSGRARRAAWKKRDCRRLEYK